MYYHISFDLELRKNPYSGLYIALEGIDGSGKTTQAQRLAGYFQNLGQPVLLTREPSDRGEIADLIRRILKEDVKIPLAGLQYLFSADRVYHHETVTTPALKEGKIVISDRVFWSAIPYGILDRADGQYDLDEAKMLLISQSILSMYHQFIVPDHTFYLRISPEEAMRRLKKEKKPVKEIYEDETKLQKTIQGYEWLVQKFPEAITVVEGEQPIEKVTREILRKLPK